MAVVEKDLLADLLERTPERTAPRPLTEIRRPTPPTPKAHRTSTIKPVLSREAMDVFKRPGLLALAVLFWSITGASTIGKMDDLLAVFGLALPALHMFILGVAVAVVLSTSEILTSESWWYVLPLTLDIAFTLWWSWPAFAHAAGVLGAPSWAALLAGIALGGISAWAPERIVFGARRKR